MTLLRETQEMTYWEEESVDGNGDPAFSAGVLFAGRWAKKDGIITDEKGNNRKTEYVIYSTTSIPKRAIVALSSHKGASAPVTEAKVLAGTTINPSMTNLMKYVL